VNAEEAENIIETYKVMKKDQKRMGTFVSYLKFWWRWKYENIRFHRQFLQTREYFISQHSHKFPPIEQAFHFYVYMRKCIRTVCIQLAGIHWSVWVIVLLIVFLESAFFESGDLSESIWEVMLVNCIVLLLTIVYMFVIWQRVIKCTDRILEAYEECCITHPTATRLAEEEKKHKQEEEDNEPLIDDGGKAKKKKLHRKKSAAEIQREIEEEEEEEDEEEEELMFGDTPEFHTGSTFWGVSTPHQKLFPFNNPAIVLRSIQFCVLLLAILEPLYIFELWQTVMHAPTGAEWFIHCTMIISPIFLCFIVVPNTLPRFVLAASVASMSRPALIKETIEKIEKEKRKEEREKARQLEEQEAEQHEHDHDEEETAPTVVKEKKKKKKEKGGGRHAAKEV